MKLFVLLTSIFSAEAAFISTPELSLSTRIPSSTTELAGVRQTLWSAIGTKEAPVEEKRNYSGFGNAYSVTNGAGPPGGYLDSLGTQKQTSPPVFPGFGNKVPKISKTVPTAKSFLRSAKEKVKNISSPISQFPGSVRSTAGSLWDRLKWKKRSETNDDELPNPKWRNEQGSLVVPTPAEQKQAQDMELVLAETVLKEAKEKTKLIREGIAKKQYEAKSNVEQLMMDLQKQEDEFRNFRSKATSLSNDFQDCKNSSHEERASLEKRLERQDSALDVLLRDAKELCDELDNMLPL